MFLCLKLKPKFRIFVPENEKFQRKKVAIDEEVSNLKKLKSKMMKK